MTLLQTPLDPYAPILEAIAGVGPNTAPIPVAHAIEYDPITDSYRYSVDVDVRIPNRISFDIAVFGATLGEALSKALTQVRRELGR